MAQEIKRKAIAQERAKFAWECTKSGKENNSVAEKYKSHVREFPMLILSNGLINAVAFVYDKGGIGKGDESGDKGWKLIYTHLEQWLKDDCGMNLIQTDGLIQELLKCETDRLRIITNETISLFTWLKRFVS
ncbi:type III-B CRISPR module-associated protein Cmr5 [Flectobacillus roseus]|uniref:type III-B CRISPR module-associated protein Cmr5 n=1 Tax=Flectobacillus roseus TaxID=502259 RepID=UPI0024B83810|nr:type III-B CRISPR module-associated protein Cmr5 [Flectobacillus roseus]MDI9870618.1 type III-B CRISPR module-associated protein Cmr5 [Flectobacillus roseus]